MKVGGALRPESGVVAVMQVQPGTIGSQDRAQIPADSTRDSSQPRRSRVVEQLTVENGQKSIGMNRANGIPRIHRAPECPSRARLAMHRSAKCVKLRAGLEGKRRVQQE